VRMIRANVVAAVGSHHLRSIALWWPCVSRGSTFTGQRTLCVPCSTCQGTAWVDPYGRAPCSLALSNWASVHHRPDPRRSDGVLNRAAVDDTGHPALCLVGCGRDMTRCVGR